MTLSRLLHTVLALGLTFALALGAVDAHAKRLGGGKNIGRQNSALTHREAVPPQQAAPTPARQQPTTPPAQQRSRWGGILGGLAAGLGLAALFHALGLGGALASFLGSALMIALLALAAFWIYSLLRRRSTPHDAAPLQYAGAALQRDAQAALGAEAHMPPQWPASQTPPQPADARQIPADFDRESFLASAKQHYLRLQQAWDAADLASLKTFTTAEMFDALSAELQQRGMAQNQTEVVTLEATLLDLQQTPTEYLASVEFSGLVREQTWGGASPVREVWNLVKPRDGSSGWLLAGIQQLN
jgi:predicted lipid-binding transport protein (Tim44 family)